jgi:hypothetical protein
VQDYFRHDLYRTIENRRARRQQSLLREEVAVKGNVIHDIDSDNDEELQHVQYIFQERRRNMRGEYESKVGGMSMGVGRLNNNNQVVVSLTD